MAKIPTYNSGLSVRPSSVTQEAPAVRIDANSFTHVNQAIGQLGVTIGDVAQKIIKVKAEQEHDKAVISSSQMLAQIETEAAQDSDFNNIESKYSKRINDIRENVLKGISSPLAKQSFSKDFELKSTYAYHDIMNGARKRFLDYDKDLMTQRVNETKESYYSATTPQEKQLARDEIASVISRRAENGVLNKAEAALLYQKEISGLDEGQAEHDILGNPVGALTELQKGQEGVYKNLTQEKRDELIKSAENRRDKVMREQEENIKKAIDLREDELIDLKIKGQLTPQMVKDERDAKKIGAKYAESMIKALENPKPKDTKSDVFNKISKDILENIKTKDEIRTDLLIENARATLSEEDFNILNTFTNNINKETIDKAMPKRNWFQRLMNSSETAQLRVEKQTQMFKEYMDKVNTGESPEKAATDIIDRYTTEQMVENNAKRNRKYYRDTQGVTIYSDDGIKYFDERTGKQIK